MAQMKMQNLVPNLKNPAALTSGILGQLEGGKKPSVGGVLDMLSGRPQPTPAPADSAAASQAKPEEKKAPEANPAGGLLDIFNSIRKKPEQKKQP